jgi:hypothetical protein
MNIYSPKIDGNTNIGLKTSSNEKTSQAGAGTSYTNFSVQEYSTSATQNTSFNGTLSHNAFDELKQQQLQYQSVFQKHNNHVHQHNVKDPANLDHNIGEVKVSSLGIPLQDFEYENSDMVDEKMAIPSASGHNSIDDDGNSQLDLVGHAGKY